MPGKVILIANALSGVGHVSPLALIEQVMAFAARPTRAPVVL